MIRRLSKQRGFTLVELMIVVAIIGILAALAVYGVRRYITSSKTAEAREMLGRIGKDASAAFQRETMAGAVLADNGAAAAANQLCTAVTTKQPNRIPVGEKVQPSSGVWTTDPGWNCLRFSFSEPVYYQYDYQSDGTNFMGVAEGDLDDDTTTGEFFSLSGIVRTGDAVLAPTVAESEEAPSLGTDPPPAPSAP